MKNLFCSILSNSFSPISHLIFFIYLTIFTFVKIIYGLDYFMESSSAVVWLQQDFNLRISVKCYLVNVKCNHCNCSYGIKPVWNITAIYCSHKYLYTLIYACIILNTLNAVWCTSVYSTLLSAQVSTCSMHAIHDAA